MNQLSFTTQEVDGILFVGLKVDGQSIVQHATENELSVWNCAEGIPSFPPYQPATDRVMVANCGCGEYGCGSSDAGISRQLGRVRLFDFQGAGTSEIHEYEFDETEFDRISSEIAAIASAYIERHKAAP